MEKEILEYLGIDTEKVKSIEDFKTAFDVDFIRANSLSDEHEAVKKIVGKKIGTIDTELKRVIGNFGIDLKDNADLKDKPIKDRIEYAMKKLIEDKDLSFEEFKKTNTGGAEAITKEWTDKYSKLENKYKDTEGLLKNISTEFEGYKQNSANEKKSFIINQTRSDALKKVKFRTGLPELMKTGFLAQIDSKYKLDIEENGSVVVMNSEGKRIPNTKVTGTFMSIDEVLENEAINSDVLEKNPHAGGKAPATQEPVKQPQHQQNQMPTKTPFRMHPNAQPRG